MERLRHSDYAGLLDFVAELQEPVPLAEFGGHLVKSTARLLPGAIIAFDQIEEASGQYRFDHNCPLSGAELERLFSRLKELYRQNPIHSYIQRGGRETVVDISNLTSQRDFQKTDFYQDIFRPIGLRHQVNVLLPRGGWINSMTINRDRPVSGRIQALLALASRHIAAAHRTACLLEELAGTSTPQQTRSLLTPREIQVVEWLGEGKRNSEIAVILGCSPRTIDKHVENILRKTGAETRTAAVRTSKGRGEGTNT
ncbi:MAG: helix-turn-helix transcriptional regulator [Luteolibacter sp.]|uniref:response regulator transcription factor n=1 Tax=Luteolibacter sp. TaxID=1962973 RepID=UPI0032668AE1